MQNDPLVEWQRLTETYSKMYDDELLQLAVDSGDLTEQAKQVLSDEMRKRGLELPRAAGQSRRMPDPLLDRAATALGVDPGAPEIVPDASETGEENDRLHEFTWKTLLCECETAEEALQLSEVLRRAGIESWIERISGSLQVVVPADRFEEALEIASNPIPEEIVELSKLRPPEFEPPVCPKCGAGDPVLEGVDPVNAWRCEACDHEWSEPALDAEESPEEAQE